MGWLEGKVALITGGARDWAARSCRAFIEEGASVGVLDRSAEGCEQLARRIGRRHDA